MNKPGKRAMTAVEMGRKGGQRRAKVLSAERRRAIAIKASRAAAKARRGKRKAR